MTDPSPDPGQGPDDPDLEDPLTADDIVNHPQDIPPASDGRGDSQATRLVSLAPVTRTPRCC
jgi:hypothetical protein